MNETLLRVRCLELALADGTPGAVKRAAEYEAFITGSALATVGRMKPFHRAMLERKPKARTRRK